MVVGNHVGPSGKRRGELNKREYLRMTNKFLRGVGQKVEIPHFIVEAVQRALGPEYRQEVVEWYRGARGYIFEWGQVIESRDDGTGLIYWEVCPVSKLLELCQQGGRSLFHSNQAIYSCVKQAWDDFLGDEATDSVSPTPGGRYCSFGWACDPGREEEGRQLVAQFLREWLEPALDDVGSQ